MTTYDAAVVGAGPAGLAAATDLARCGANVLLLDENPEAGGQYHRAMAACRAPGVAWMREAQHRRDVLVGGARAAGIELRTQAAVVDLRTGWELTIHDRAASAVERVGARCVIAATGAHELVLPFRGWTLPGVMTLGGAQTLLKSQGLLPGGRVVLAGTGPFLWLVAQQLVRAGAEIVAIAEAAAIGEVARFAAGAWRHTLLALAGAGHWARIGASRVRVLFGHGVIAAEGTGRLAQVRLAPIGSDWRVRGDASVALEADALCVSHALLPATELTRLAGCRHAIDPVSRVPVPAVDALLETSAPGLFAAGEAIGIGGGVVADVEGRLAALGAAMRLGIFAEGRARAAVASLSRTRGRKRRFAREIQRRFAPGEGALDWMAAGTPLCRCENVARSRVDEALAAGFTTVDLVKSFTRCGMGPCQGRLCGPVVQRTIAAATGEADVQPGAVQPPLKPVPVADFLAGPLQDIAGRRAAVREGA